MNTMVVLGDAETVLAFALGGVRGHVAQSAEQAQAVWGALLAGDERHTAPTLVLVTHAVAAHLRNEVAALRRRPTAPLVVEICGFAETPQESSSARLVNHMLRTNR